jgi:hypothetical protein
MKLVPVALTLLLSACSSAPTSTRAPATDSPAPLDWTVIQNNFQGDAWKIMSAAELRQYKDVYFESDIHGRIIAFANLLYQAKLVDSPSIDANGDATGKWIGKQALLVLDGDYIDGGESSAQVLRWIEALHKQAGNDLIPLLGNHEAELLADPEVSELKKETLASFGITPDLAPISTTLHTYKLGLVLGSWFIAHSGYIVPESGDLKAWLAAMSSAWSGGTKGFASLTDPKGTGASGVLERHDWWNHDHELERQTLNSVGLNGFIGGHEPKLFGDDKTKILISQDKWAAKIDTGLKDASADSTSIGEILHCSVAAVDAGNGSLLTLDNCDRLTSDGSLKSLKVNN